MTFKKNILLTFIMTVIGSMIVVGANVVIDSYGIYRKSNVAPKFKTYNNEIVEKTFYSFSYVKKNFDTVLVGPSYAANINTKNITDKKIYNLAARGLDISLFEKPVINAISNDSKVKNLVICLDPYFFDKKKVSIHVPSNYYETLGSISLFKRYLFQILDKYKVKTYDTNEYGYINYSNERRGSKNFKEDLVKLYKKEKNYIKINDFDKTIKSLERILKVAEINKVNVIGYMHPRVFEDYQYNVDVMNSFKAEIRKHLNFIDFNANTHKEFTTDHTNYSDLGHFSVKGANNFMSNYLYPKLKVLLK